MNKTLWTSSHLLISRQYSTREGIIQVFTDRGIPNRTSERRTACHLFCRCDSVGELKWIEWDKAHTNQRGAQRGSNVGCGSDRHSLPLLLLFFFFCPSSSLSCFVSRILFRPHYTCFSLTATPPPPSLPAPTQPVLLTRGARSSSSLTEPS